MHIGIDTRLTYYRTGGISTYMRRLVSALETLDTKNEYTIFQSRKAADMIAKRFRTAALWTPCHHPLERITLTAELIRFRLDVFHSPDFIPPLHGARKHIITVHDLTFLHYPEYLTADSRRFYNGQIQSAVKQADHILAYSLATKTDMMQMLGVPSEKITMHTLGVDERFKPLPEQDLTQAAEEIGLPKDYILFVGTFEPRKNILGLLRAYKILVSKMPDAPPVVLVGKPGWLFEETVKQVQDMRLSDHLIWRSDITDEQLPSVYNCASVLVMPSFYEGFGLPALEAMACGTVPVVSNRSSLPEVVGDVGLQVNPDDPEDIASAIEHVLTDKSWRESMSRIGIERSKLFTWHSTAAVVRAVYEAV